MANLSFYTPTMSSRVIADLTGKRHDNVMTDCRKLAQFYTKKYSPEKSGELVKSSTYTDPTGRALPCFELSKDASIDLVTGYSLPHRHAVNQRWQELEAQAAAPAVNTLQALSDPTTLLAILHGYAERALVDDREKRALEHQVEDLAPKAALIDRIMASPESQTITQASKVLGVTIRRLTTWLHEHGWVYRQNGAWIAYKKHIDNGDLEYKEAHYTDAKTGQACIKPYCHITQRGLVKIAKLMNQEAA